MRLFSFRRASVLAIIFIALVTAACDPMIPAIEPTVPTPTLSGSPTPSPTATVTPLPTASPTPDFTPTPTAFPCSESGMVVSIEENRSVIARENLPYQAYLPPCYQSSLKRYPLVLLLGDQAGSSALMETLNIGAIMDDNIRRGTLPPMVVVIAELGRQGTRNQFPPEQSAETVIRTELLPALERDFCLYEQRDYRAIGGFGRGGFWAALLAFKTPELFTAVGGHSTLLDNSVPPGENPLEIARNSTSLPAARLRYYFDNGAEDVAAGTGLQLLSDRFTARQIAHTYLVNPVGGADSAYWSSHIADYLDFYGRSWPKDYAALPSCETPSP